MPKTTLSATEAARRLSVGLNFLYDLIRAGKLEADKKGKRWAISTRAVDLRLARLSKNLTKENANASRCPEILPKQMLAGHSEVGGGGWVRPSPANKKPNLQRSEEPV